MVCIRLYGDFAHFLGKSELHYSVSSVREAFEAIYANFPQARKYIVERERQGLFFRIVLNEEKVLEQTYEVEKTGEIYSIDLVPCLIGNGPITTAIIIAVALSAVSAGISAILTPKPKFEAQKNEVSTNAGARSTFFGGRTNNLTQGVPVPVIYGRVKAGSNVISARIRNFDLLSTGDFSPEVNRLLAKYGVGKEIDLTQFTTNVITSGITRTDLYTMPFTFMPGKKYSFIGSGGNTNSPKTATSTSRNYDESTQILRVEWSAKYIRLVPLKNGSPKIKYTLLGYSEILVASNV